MSKILIITGIIIIVIVIIIVAVLFLIKGPDLARYEFLKEPRITTIENRKVLEVEVKGEPGKLLQDAFGLLMQTYYKLKGVPKGPGQSAPALRCFLPEGVEIITDQDFQQLKDWTGKVAIPVPDSVTTLPDIKTKPGIKLSLVTWEYGLVAEILHIGPYEKETAAIKKLTDYITAQGYAVTGEHEEEYLRGPGMPFSSPESYYTIIRYRILKNQ